MHSVQTKGVTLNYFFISGEDLDLRPDNKDSVQALARSGKGDGSLAEPNNGQGSSLTSPETHLKSGMNRLFLVPQQIKLKLAYGFHLFSSPFCF